MASAIMAHDATPAVDGRSSGGIAACCIEAVARVPVPAARPRGLLAMFRTWAALRRQRRDLARLERHQLNDIGLSLSDARAEAARRVWDVPPGWRL